MGYGLRWGHVGTVGQVQYQCSYCGNKVGPNAGYHATPPGQPHLQAYIFICPTCTNPTYVNPQGIQIPAPRLGNDVKGISDVGVQTLYNEARDCTGVGAHTAAVLVCRKILMHVAVEQGAQPGQKFVEYVDHLDAKGFVPPNGKAWVDAIRKKGNEANHEIVQMAEADARQILQFVEMLLKFVYEFPSLLGTP